MTRKRKAELKAHQEHKKYMACGRKEKYDTASEALAAGRTVNFYNRTEIEFRAYFCPFCCHHHLTGN